MPSKCDALKVLISLLRLWTHNQPFSNFPRNLSTTPRHHATLCCLFTTLCHLNVPLRDMIQASGTAHTLFQHPEKPWHVPRHAMCSVTLSKDSLRNLDQPQCHTLLYIVSHSSTLEWCVPCMPSCLKFYSSYKLFPSLNSCFTILFNYFGLLLCFLSVTNQPHSHFSLHYFTIKPPVHRRKKKKNLPPL